MDANSNHETPEESEIPYLRLVKRLGLQKGHMRQGIARDFVLIQAHGAGYVAIEDSRTHLVEMLVFESGLVDVEGCKGKPVYFQCNESGVLTDLMPVTVCGPVKGGYGNA